MANFEAHKGANANFAAYIREMFDASLTWKDLQWLVK